MLSAPQSLTPVPAGFKFAWSYGAVNTYEICPRKYWAEKVAKSVPYVKGEATLWGEDVHAALETGAKAGTPLPSNMSQYEPTLEKVRQLASISIHIEYERQFAVTPERQPCSWFGNNVYGRAASDVFALVTPQVGIILDYKTGKPPRSKTLQPVINARMAFDHYPELQQVTTSFIYMQHKRTDKDDFYRANIDIDWQPVGEVIWQIENSIAHQNFPARKGFLCNAYCGDFSCPHNGRSK
jgi:hypothetical protein